MVSMLLHSAENVVELRVEGAVTREDYDNIVPELDPVLGNRKQAVGFLVRLDDFDGWSPGALERELAFDLKNRAQIGPIAVVGEGRLAQGTTQVSSFFFPAEVRFFSLDQLEEARAWLGLPAPAAVDGTTVAEVKRDGPH